MYKRQIGHTAIQVPVYEKPQPKEENKPLLLPEKCAYNIVITEYLCGRGIDFEIINYCISKDLIFESLPYHNVVFVGYDEKKEPDVYKRQQIACFTVPLSHTLTS